ncbi:protein phosphatase 1 regulatory subunit 15B [Heptranchias perlo]|uniref:protein phosphatase 1 regulatory subunit 15B n=1 Tax=Heptranchias perlo TaxID=212740 RepID=UPI0035596232
MALVKHVYTEDSTAFTASVTGSFSALWHLGVTLMAQFRDFLGLLIKFHTVLQLCRTMLLKFTDKAPSSSEQADEVKISDKEFLIFPWFGRVGSTIDNSGLQCGPTQQANLIDLQCNSSKYNLNSNKGTLEPLFTSKDNIRLSPEGYCSQDYLSKKSNQDHLMDDCTCTTDSECVAVNHSSSHCTIPKNSICPTEWNNMVTTKEDYDSIDSEEWDDSDEESDTLYSSDDSFTDEDDQEQREMPWKSFLTADPYNPLNFTAYLTSSSTIRKMPVDLNEQGLGEREKGRNNLAKLKSSISQKPILPQRHFRHFCNLSDVGNVKYYTWKKPKKSIKLEGENKEVEKAAVKKLRFSPLVEVHKMITWPFASRAARRGQWVQMAHDRARFLHRIWDTEQQIGYCLQRNHRKKIWEKIHGQTRIEECVP